MKRRKAESRFALVVAVCLGAPLAHAQVDLELAAPPYWKGDWEQKSDETINGRRHVVLKPVGTPADSVKDLVTVVFMRPGAQRGTVARLTEEWASQVRKTCPDVRTVLAPLRDANGYSVGYARLDCPKRADTSEGSVDLVKVIAAEKDAFLVVVAQRTPPFAVPAPGQIQYERKADADAIGQWLKSMGGYLQSTVRACDLSNPLVKVCSP